MIQKVSTFFALTLVGILAIIGAVNVYNGVCFHGALLSCHISGAELSVINEGCESRGCLKTPVGEELPGIVYLAYNEHMIAGIAHEESAGVSLFVVETSSFKICHYNSTAEFLSAISSCSEGRLEFHSPLYVVSARM